MPEKCFLCANAIEKDDGIALGEVFFHTECFKCTKCKVPLEMAFYDEKGRLFCEKHNPNTITILRCEECKHKITDQYITVQKKSYHNECFVCDECKKPLTSATCTIRKENGMPYCKACLVYIRDKKSATEVVTDICAQCNKTIRPDEPWLIRGEKRVHSKHFHCNRCQVTIERNGAEWDDQLYCEACYRVLSTAVCAACNQMIVGRSVTAMGLQFHPEHFVCTKCSKPFLMGEYFEHLQLPYCKQHYHEIQGSLCGRCFKGPTGQVVLAIDLKWCEGHFRCFGCDVDLAVNPDKVRFVECDTRPYCRRCYDVIPFKTRKNLLKYEEMQQKAKVLNENARKHDDLLMESMSKDHI